MKTDYRPANIEFYFANSEAIKENLGVFEDAKKANAFIREKFTAINSKLEAVRLIDTFEKKEIRDEYIEMLEVELPFKERELNKANRIFEDAKRKLNEAKETVNACVTEIKALANEVKRGTRNINLDDVFTWRIPYKSNYLYYTYIDKQIKLCKVLEIPEHEKTQLWNALNKNSLFFDKTNE